jgi:signal transduction histidine kinase
MRFGIQTKQVAGVTALVSLAVVVLSAWFVTRLARDYIEESQARAQLVARIVFQRASEIVTPGGDPKAELQNDGGLRSILLASVFDKTLLYAAIVDTDGVIITGNDADLAGQHIAPATDTLPHLLSQGAIAQARAIYAGTGTYEYDDPLILVGPDASGPSELGSIRVGVSTLLIRDKLNPALRTPLLTALLALVGGSLVAMLLARLVLRPIHVIRSGLARLGRGELDVHVDLPEEGELAGLGDSFKAITARLARTELAGQKATIESVVEYLEDAVALFAPDGTVLFANPAMRALLGPSESTLSELLPAGHPFRTLVEETLSSQQSRGPMQVTVPDAGERLILSHAIEDVDHRSLGVVLVARNLAYLSQVESTLSYSRKLAALGRLSAGIAHEVKNPLNATMIHLELLKLQLADRPTSLEHVQIITAQVRRLDEVVQGFLKFTRPEDLKLGPVALPPLIQEFLPVVLAEASKSGVDVRVDCPPTLPPVSADAGMLEQALLNLALNACQAMPNGGRLLIAAAARPNRRVEIVFEDSGVGIPPEDLGRIFDLYFTTKEHGSGIGLSMVYRTVQLHDGEIEVQSVPGRGTTFRILLREA